MSSPNIGPLPLLRTPDSLNDPGNIGLVHITTVIGMR